MIAPFCEQSGLGRSPFMKADDHTLDTSRCFEHAGDSFLVRSPRADAEAEHLSRGRSTVV